MPMPTAKEHMIGQIRVVEDPDDPPETWDYAVIIRFETIEEFREAVRLGTARFWPETSKSTSQ